MVFGMMIIFLNLQHDVSGPECKSLREQGTRKKRERCPFVCLRLRLWRCSASGSHELFVRGNCMPNCMCLRARVCLRMWSLFTQPSGRSLKHLGITRSALPGVRASGCPGGWGVSPSTSPPLPTSGIRRSTYKAIFHFDSTVFFMWVTLTLTRPNEQLTFGFGELCMFVRMWPLLYGKKTSLFFYPNDSMIKWNSFGGRLNKLRGVHYA